MSEPHTILVVDDNAENREILGTRLRAHGYLVETAVDGEDALESACRIKPSLILLDIMMPKIDGIEVCRRLKQDPSFPFTPIILVTAKADAKDVVTGLEAGAEEYITKPVDQTALIARVRSMLRVKALHDEREASATALAALNAELEQRIQNQVAELHRLSQLERFFSPQLASWIVDQGDAVELETHRREIAVLYSDLRGFTAFSSQAEPEEEMALMREYHRIVGALIFERGATLEHIAGDGVMAFFNDPVPCTVPALRAVRLALEMRERVAELLAGWSRRGFSLGFGVGAALGYATLGHLGVEGQFHYAAIGSVSNLAARLCDQAADGQVLIDPRLLAAGEGAFACEAMGELTLKGFANSVPAYNVTSSSDEIALPYAEEGDKFG